MDLNAFPSLRRHPSIVVALMSGFLIVAVRAESPPAGRLLRDQHGGIVRGDVSQRKLALVFTGDEFGESAAPILDVLKQRRIAGAFFVTGNFVRNPKLTPVIKRAIAEGHYVGPHSDKHPLYAPWDDRDTSLLTQQEFNADLQANIAALQAVGALAGDGPIYFIPPYEQFNRDQVAWSKALNVRLINFTPGSGSNRDYAREGDKVFVPSQKLLDDILAYEKTDPHGLNGFVLLLHLGSGRMDPFHTKLGALCDELTKRGYVFERIDKLLAE